MSNTRLSLPCPTYSGTEPYIFISYSHVDEEQVFPEIKALDEHGLRVWYDDGIGPSSEWREEIARAITGSAMFIVFITRNSIQSRSVIKEVNFAVDEIKPFLAIHLEEVTLPPGLRLTMGDIQAIMKWRMTAADYWRKMMDVLPVDCLDKTRQIFVPDVCIHNTDENKPEVKQPPLCAPRLYQPDWADTNRTGRADFITRDLTPDFLPEEPLEFPVKVFHQKIQADDTIQAGSLVFILHPVRLCQLDLKLLLQYHACFVLVKDSSTARIPPEQHWIKLLLENKNANRYLESIKGLHKNVLELHIDQNKPWDFLGRMSSGKPLFRIRHLNFCFIDFPIVQEDTLALDEVFIQEAAEPVKPIDVIGRYLEIIENHAASKFEATNRRNALQKVFPFYKSNESNYILNLNADDVSFLVDILRLEEEGSLIRKAIGVGALTAACSYFIHSGHPLGFRIIMERLLRILDENGDPFKYQQISDADLDQLKIENAFLYYHLTCRIPNQYVIAVFDLFLIETDPRVQSKYEATIMAGLQYLKRQIKELSLMPEVLLWEFKRDQEIAALAGTIGQLTLYMRASLKGDDEAFGEAEKYLQIAVEYAHPAEQNRDENYLIRCRLARIIRETSRWEQKQSEIAKELKDLALILAKRFLIANHPDPFDAMFSASVIAVANVTVSSEFAEELYAQMGFPWENISRMMSDAPHQYALFLLVSYLFLAPPGLIEGIPDFELLVNKAVAFFKLNGVRHQPENMLDLIALKLIIAHGWYLSIHGAEKDLRKLKNYQLRIETAPMYAKWAPECVAFLRECVLGSGSPFKALRLIYRIPY